MTKGQYKARFGCLQTTIEFDPPKVAEIITGTACLHNLAVARSDIWVEDGLLHHVDEHDARDNFNYVMPNDIAGRIAGQRKRDEIAMSVFGTH